MHRIKRVFRLVHIVLWTLLTLLTILQLSGESNRYWVSITLGFMLTNLYVFYGHFYLLTAYPGKKPKPYFVKLGIIVLSGPLPFILFRYEIMSAMGFISFYAMVVFTMVPIFLLLGWLARVTENLVINTVKKEQLEKQAVQAELYYLKSQINPHFLFNTLNNIHTLVYKQAPAAPEAVVQLASLMRYMIYESNAPLVPLAREMDYLQDYVALQQLKYKKSPVVDLEIAGPVESCYIAPLLFIHLLENAFKHSPARLEPGDIKVSMHIIEDTLTVIVRNPVGSKEGNTLEEPGGIGLQNVRKRLALLYPGQHSLETVSSGSTFAVTLKIQGLKISVNEKKTDLLYN